MIFTAATPEYQRAYTVEKCGRTAQCCANIGFLQLPARPFALGYSMGVVLRVLDPIHPSPLTKRLGQSQNLGQMFIIRFAGQGGVSRTWQGGVWVEGKGMGQPWTKSVGSSAAYDSVSRRKLQAYIQA